MFPMVLEEKIFAKGHRNITSTHRTTLEITMDADITSKGSCIIAVSASKGLNDFSDKMKNAIRHDDAKIRLIIKAGPLSEVIEGYGCSRLTLKNDKEIVCRRSSYTCDRTLMIKCDKAAKDLAPEIKRMLLDEETILEITVRVIQPTDKSST